MAIVIKPVRVNHKGDIIGAPHIVCDEGIKAGEAVQQAKEYSGLSRFKSWNFLVYGTLENGSISVADNYLKQVIRLSFSSLNKRKNARS